MATIPLCSNIPGFFGAADPGRALSVDEACTQLARAIIWLKHPEGPPLSADLQAFLVEGFRRQLKRPRSPGTRERFIECVERGEPIPPDLRTAIVGRLRKQIKLMESGTGASGWLGGKAGRPSKAGDSDADWIKMWAWYCYHRDLQFAYLPKSLIAGGRADTVGMYLHAALVKFRVPLPGLSARNVMRYVDEFARSGFRPIPEGALAMAQNFTKARLFCVCWLGLSNEATHWTAPLVATEGKTPPVDIDDLWARQADRSTLPPPPSPAEVEARRIINFWHSQRFAAESKSRTFC